MFFLKFWVWSSASCFPVWDNATLLNLKSVTLALASNSSAWPLRDIGTFLNAKPEALYHSGFCEPVSKSTLADANEQRSWRLWVDLANNPMCNARTLYAGEDLGLELENTVYALDSTTIDLSLTLFPWADFRRTKAEIKMRGHRAGRSVSSALVQ